jgi:ATP-dependent Clp protease ATP-binding subunit ClpC
MFERYTERARRVIFFARYEASALGSSSIDTEHLLLGLLREGGSLTARIFKRIQLSHHGVCQEIEARTTHRETISTSVDMPLSLAAKRVLGYASGETERAASENIDSEHILLGLLCEADSVAAEILRGKGLRLEHLREEVRANARPHVEPPSPNEAFQKLSDFLRQLEARGATYHVRAFHKEGLRVEVPVADEMWVATFFIDGRVAVEVLSASAGVEDETALARLLERLGSRPPSGG